MTSCRDKLVKEEAEYKQRIADYMTMENRLSVVDANIVVK